MQRAAALELSGCRDVDGTMLIKGAGMHGKAAIFESQMFSQLPDHVTKFPPSALPNRGALAAPSTDIGMN
jgi:hypothetical protein